MDVDAIFYWTGAGFIVSGSVFAFGLPGATIALGAVILFFPVIKTLAGR